MLHPPGSTPPHCFRSVKRARELCRPPPQATKTHGCCSGPGTTMIMLLIAITTSLYRVEKNRSWCGYYCPDSDHYHSIVARCRQQTLTHGQSNASRDQRHMRWSCAWGAGVFRPGPRRSSAPLPSWVDVDPKASSCHDTTMPLSYYRPPAENPDNNNNIITIR